MGFVVSANASSAQGIENTPSPYPRQRGTFCFLSNAPLRDFKAPLEVWGKRGTTYYNFFNLAARLELGIRNREYRMNKVDNSEELVISDL
jgi:hypothetical protein